MIRDDRLYRLYCSYIDDFLKMKTADPKAKRKRGVGLGSEVSQITALDAASPIDHYFKDRRRVAAYGRYMDDGYAISPSLEELRDQMCIRDRRPPGDALGGKLGDPLHLRKWQGHRLV